ncbi:2456_t:CDS:2, partial [Diversispora eburnea]
TQSNNPLTTPIISSSVNLTLAEKTRKITISKSSKEKDFETTITSPFTSSILELPGQSSTVPTQIDSDTWTTNLIQQIKGEDYFESLKSKITTSDSIHLLNKLFSYSRDQVYLRK